MEEQIIYKPENITLDETGFHINEEGKKEIHESLVSLFGIQNTILNLNTMLSTMIIDMNGIIKEPDSIDVIELAKDISELEFYLNFIKGVLNIPTTMLNQFDLKIYETYYQRILEFREEMEKMKEKKDNDNEEITDPSETVE